MKFNINDTVYIHFNVYFKVPVLMIKFECQRVLSLSFKYLF
jgi:hypothetical protein